jgi:hypothetical protein
LHSTDTLLDASSAEAVPRAFESAIEGSPAALAARPNLSRSGNA